MIFPYIWYLFIISCIILYITNIDQIYSLIDIELLSFVKIIWNLPVYFLYEIIFFSLIIFDNKKERKHNINKVQTFNNLAIIIPVHKPSDGFYDTLFQNFQIFENNIWVAENDNNIERNYDLQQYCQSYGINYRHYPIANKANSILETVREIKQKHSYIKNILLLDDDTILQNDFFIREDLLKDKTVAGYCCSIGVNKNEKFNLWEHLIDFEYRAISIRNRSRNYQTLKFLHGIVCIYKIDALLDIYKWNCCLPGGLPFGEDAFAGLQARMIGYKMKHDSYNTVLTYCPNKLLNFGIQRTQGYGASSIFKQRVLRWYLSWPRRFFHEVSLFLFYDTGSWLGNILYRIDSIWYLYILYIAISWLVFSGFIFSQKNFLNFIYIHVCFYIINIISSYSRIFLMNSKEKENIKWFIPLLYPFFLILVLFLYSFSFIYSISYFIPFVRIDYNKVYSKISYE